MDETSHPRHQKLVDSTSDPAFGVDEEGNVSGWNEAAERLLGYSSAVVVGQPCYQILRGRDVFGNPYCQPDCPLHVITRRHRAVRHFQMEIYGKDETPKRVLCFVLVIPGSTTDTFGIVHLLRPLDRPLPPWPDRQEIDDPPLTNREIEVLRHLADGITTAEIAETLSITTSTVRKHIQNLFRKLGVRNRLAVVLAAFERQIL